MTRSGRRWLLAALAAAAAFFLLPWQWLAHWEDDTVDFRLRLRGVRPVAPAVVLVTVEDSSFSVAARAPAEATREPALAAMGAGWPWDRRVFGALVQKLAAAGARAVVFDFVFASETPGDAAFAASLGATPVPVVLARQFSPAETLEGERSVTALEPREPLARAGKRVTAGLANLTPDDDGVVRTARPTLAAGDLLGGPDTGARDPILASAAAAVAGAPVQPDRTGAINYRGPAGAFPTVPVEHLFLADRWDGPVLAHGALFKDKVVIVGPGSELRFKDFHATPFGRMSGAELQANLVESLLGPGLLRLPTEGETRLAVLLAVALAGGVCLTGLGARVQVAALGLALIGWLGFAQGVLLGAGWLVPVVAPVCALGVAGATGVGFRYAREQRERRRLRSLLSSYVSEKVAEVIVRQPESLEAALHGERRPVTVLFSDLRGFTTLTEERPAADLVAQLNEYLRAMVDCILAEGGTVQKYIGDAILAVWGDTHTEGEARDAEQAVAAALAMEEALARLNATWSGRADRPPLRMGIGLNQGTVTVGNLGHPRRMEFGVLGDAVNTASRIEAATKPLGIGLLAGCDVARLASGRFRFLPVGRVLVPGRRAAVDLFTPLGQADAPAPAWLPDHEKARALLDAGRLAEAAAAFGALKCPESRAAAVVEFQRRHAARLAAAAHPEWDGTIRLTDK